MRSIRNDYADEVPPWKVKLMVARARRLGFRADELEDVQQELVLDVRAFRFDASRSNGASETTALVALIDNRLRALRRARGRYERRVEKFRADLEAQARPADGARLGLAMDVRATLAGLTDRQRRLCELLTGGASLRDIAVSFRCCRERARKMRDTLAVRLRAAGLAGWVEG